MRIIRSLKDRQRSFKYLHSDGLSNERLPGLKTTEE